MAKRDDNVGPVGGGDQGLVPVVVARAVAEAEEFCHLLEDHDIHAVVGTDDELDRLDDAGQPSKDNGPSHGIPVLVPEALLDEAGEIIAEREGFEELVEEEGGDDDDADDEDFGLSEDHGDPADPSWREDLADEDDDEPFDVDEDDEGFLDDDTL
ncbi:MAG: hypothetical protein ACYS8X_00245 [Planctomycetota bacterium]|jgi:hypothetical protein